MYAGTSSKIMDLNSNGLKSQKKNSKTIFDHVSHGTRLLPSYSFYLWANDKKKKRLAIVVFVVRYFAKRNIYLWVRLERG